MIENDKRIAEELKKRLSEVVQIVDVKVFGSRARGDADEFSDLDVFLEVESLDRSLKEQVFDIVWEVGFENERVITTIVLDSDQFEKGPMSESTLVSNILQEGVAA